MYFTNDNFVISGLDIFWIIFGIITIIAILKLLDRIVGRIVSRWTSKSEDYPGSAKSSDLSDMHQENNRDTKMFSDIADVYYKSDLEKERRKRVIFEEMISNVPFRYDEKTKMLTIGEGHNSSVEPIKVKLSGLKDLREFVDRLEDYVDE